MDQQLARRLLAEALPTACGSGDDGIEPLACFLLGVSLFLSGQLDPARQSLSRALELYSAAGDQCGIGRWTATLGVVAFFGGDWPRATATLEHALALVTAAGDRWGEGLCHTYLGLTAKETPGMRGAERHLLEGLRLLTPLRDVAILQVAGLVTVGLTNAQVAHQLPLSHRGSAKNGYASCPGWGNWPSQSASPWRLVIRTGRHRRAKGSVDPCTVHNHAGEAAVTARTDLASGYEELPVKPAGTHDHRDGNPGCRYGRRAHPLNRPGGHHASYDRPTVSYDLAGREISPSADAARNRNRESLLTGTPPTREEPAEPHPHPSRDCSL